MIPARFRFAALLFSLALSSAHGQQPATDGLKLPSIISNHMVLQGAQEDPLWGWAAAGTAVHIKFLDPQGRTLAKADTTTPADGKWLLRLPALSSCTAGTLQITAGASVRTIEDVVVGEAWLCGGQSNMTYNFSAANIPPEMRDTARREAAAAHGAIRFFTAAGASAATPQDDSKGQWFVVAPDSLGNCSCVAWNFAVALREKLDRPMGMVVCAVGGTRAEQWMSQAAIDGCPSAAALQKRDLQTAAPPAIVDQWKAADAAWRQANPTPQLQSQNIKTRPVLKGKIPRHFCDLYNGMLHGLVPYGVKGVIWFQADGNLDTVLIYGDLIKAVITSWRAEWQKQLPFYYVEMNNMRGKVQTVPVETPGPLALLRERQTDALVLPDVDVVVSIDCGLASGEPHFPDKKPVGQRLALLAFDHVYDLPCVSHSPAYKGFTVEGNKIRVRFDDADGLRVRGGGDPAGFAIRATTGNWVWATGRVDGRDVLLWSDQVPQPAAARYAWAANPVTSMENGACLPMRPFRTDTDSSQ